MRRIVRESLDADVQYKLDQKRLEADRKCSEGNLEVGGEWKNARQTKPLLTVLATLKHMMGECERCMYCLDSHGTDIEHFWPKALYPERMFLWSNLLLCCAECGRFKGDHFPLDNGQPLLVDPTAEEPWTYLDFDPATGNVIARFEIDRNDWSLKGQATVDTLQLDRREALSNIYQRTYRRLVAVIEQYLAKVSASVDSLVVDLRNADDHGLLGWGFVGTGQQVSPFSDLREKRPDAWAACVAACQIPHLGAD